MSDTQQPKEFTPRQLKAIEARLAGMSFTEVAKEAGYSSKETAWEALTNPHVKQELTERLNASMRASDLTPDHIINGLWAIATNTKEPAGARVRALELMGKTDFAGSLFSDRLRIEHDNPQQSVEIALGLIKALMTDHRSPLVQAINEADIQEAEWSEEKPSIDDNSSGNETQGTEDTEGLYLVSHDLCLKTAMHDLIDGLSEVDLKSFIYTHFGMPPPKPLINQED